MDRDFPLNLYLYDENGRYGEPIIIPSKETLHGPGTTLLVKSHIAKKLEVRITDSEDATVFHSQNGELLFPKPEDLCQKKEPEG
jgi:hypothetical protein